MQWAEIKKIDSGLRDTDKDYLMKVMTVMTKGAHRCNCKDTRSYQELACATTRIRGLFWRLKLGEPSLTAPLTYG